MFPGANFTTDHMRRISPALCEAGAVTLVYICWVNAYTDFISAKLFPEEKVGAVPQNTTVKSVGHDPIWAVTTDCRDHTHFGE